MNSTTIVVFRKEIIDMFRDRKTLLIGILIPLVMFPITSGVIGKSVNKSTKSVEDNLKIAIIDKGNSSLGQLIKS